MSNNLINVFITYAHESDEFRDSVKELAIWLNTHGHDRIIVTTDHIYENRAPINGWQVWMMEQAKDSDIVLIVCTPKYHARFLKNEEPNKGRGVILEAAIITTHLYDCQLLNEKFIPIIPDGGLEENVPDLLKPFFNYLSFPKHNERILKSILNDNPTLEAINLENQIVTEIIIENIQREQNMLPSVHTLVRHFLSLSDFEKVDIAKKLTVFKEEFITMPPDERDKEIFKAVKEKNILKNLWEEINSINPFGIQNPFK